MTTATVSAKYQVVIPRAVRERPGIEPGQQVQMLVHDGRLEIVPVRDLKEMRGFLEGIDTSVPREGDRV